MESISRAQVILSPLSVLNYEDLPELQRSLASVARDLPKKTQS